MAKVLDSRGSESSRSLFFRARGGDRAALEHLFERLVPPLRRWARGRLPRNARSGADTGDLVQEALLGALRSFERFEPRRSHALRSYLRQAIRNRVRDELRRAGRRPVHDPLVEEAVVAPDSPLETVLSEEQARSYQRALAALRPEEQELVIARVELGYSYEQIALATGRASADAARMAVRRALLRLAEGMTAG